MNAGDTLTAEQREQDRRISDLERRVSALEPSPPIDPPIDPPVDPPVTPPATGIDLGINLSFERYTNCLEPDPLSETGYTITDQQFIDLYSQYQTIRVMDWQMLLSSRDRNRNWSNRTDRSDYRADLPNRRWDGGVPIEALIEVANACNSDIWLCLYQQSDADHARQMGKLFSDLLNPGLHVYLEGPNEAVWQSNRGWYYYKKAGDFATVAKLYAEDCALKFRAFAETFDPARTTRILGGQLASVGVLKSHILKHIADSDYDAITVSGYFGNNQHKGEDWKTGKHGLQDSMAALSEHKKIAIQHNKKLMAYELNQHIEGDLTLVDSDPVIAGVGTMIAHARSLGASPICLYSGVGNRYSGSPWALYDKTYKPRPPAVGLGLPTI